MSAQLEQELKDVEIELCKVNAARDTLVLQQNSIKATLIHRRYGVQVGSTVRDKRGSRFVVTNVRVTNWTPVYDKPWLSGNLIKKDGALGTRECLLYTDWEVCE